jgi:hemerythrin-like domain-containing protein
VCDYCGCRTAPAIDELSDEHDRLLNLGHGARRRALTEDYATIVALLESEFLPLLAAHTRKEEAGLFAELRASWEADDRIAALEDEHEEIDALFDVVRRGGHGWRGALDVAVRLLSDHVMDEETDLFPYALYALSPEQWADVTRRHAPVASTSV